MMQITFSATLHVMSQMKKVNSRESLFGTVIST
jgi:hypothetical protein